MKKTIMDEYFIFIHTQTHMRAPLAKCSFCVFVSVFPAKLLFLRCNIYIYIYDPFCCKSIFGQYSTHRNLSIYYVRTITNSDFRVLIIFSSS